MKKITFHFQVNSNFSDGNKSLNHQIYQDVFEDTKRKFITSCSEDTLLSEKFIKSLISNELHRKIIRPIKALENVKVDFAVEKLIENKITFLLEMFDSENNLLVFSRITEKINPKNMDDFKSILTKITNPTDEK